MVKRKIKLIVAPETVEDLISTRVKNPTLTIKLMKDLCKRLVKLERAMAKK